MNIVINTLFEWLTDDELDLYRVLWISPSVSEMIVFKFGEEKLDTPILLYEEFERAYYANEIRILANDPYASYMRPDNTISEKRCKRRDDAWEIIKPLVEDENPKIFNSLERGLMIQEVIKRTRKSKITIYRYLRIYWQRGQTVNALLPDDHRKGSKGKQKKVGSKKKGRPNKNGERTGINVTDTIRDYFRYGISLLKNKKVNTQKEALQRVIERHFNLGYELKEGVNIPVLPSDEELPTIKQFRDFYKEEVDPVEMSRAIIGENRFNLRNRSMHGDSTVQAFGPGSIYQFDSTVADVSLISLLDPSLIVNRPIVYLGVDVFSRMIVSVGISFENASWMGFKVAFENAAADKVKFCEQHGIEISEDQWPCRYLPKSIVADRAEVNSSNGRHLTKSLGTQISITAPYRADMKGIVEQLFNWVNKAVNDSLPGTTPDEYGRGDKDYRLSARLNIQEYRKLLLRAVLYYNQYQYIRGYPDNEFMIGDGVKKIPLDLWNWGIRNRGGLLKTAEPDVLHLNLLPRLKASITRDGICFKGIWYTCDLPEIQQRIAIIAVKKRREKVWISYNPHSKIDEIYLNWDDGEIITCYRTNNPKTQKFQGFDFWEVENYQDTERQKIKDQEVIQRQGMAELNAHKDSIVNIANKRTEEAIKDSGMSNNARTKNTRANRQGDRDLERKEKDGSLSDRAVSTTRPETKPSQPEQLETTEIHYIEPPSYLSLLDQLDQED